MPGPPTGDLELVAEALAHPLRVAWIGRLRVQTPLSPSRFSAGRAGHRAGARKRLGQAAYHVRALLGLGVVELVETRTDGRGEEHLYRLSYPTARPVVEVVEALGGRRSVVDSEGETVRLGLTDDEVAGVARVIEHPTRLAIARDMCGDAGTCSPAAWARGSRVSLDGVAHQFRMLERLGFLSLVRVEEGPTAFRHLYRARDPLALAVRVTLDLLEGRVGLEPAGQPGREPHDRDGLGGGRPPPAG